MISASLLALALAAPSATSVSHFPVPRVRLALRPEARRYSGGVGLSGGAEGSRGSPSTRPTRRSQRDSMSLMTS